MSTMTLFILSDLGIVTLFLVINIALSFKDKYKEKISSFECGFHSFIGQSRLQFHIAYFLFGIAYILLDTEIITLYPMIEFLPQLEFYGTITVVLFVIVVTLGFAFEYRKGALKLKSEQDINILSDNFSLDISFLGEFYLNDRVKIVPSMEEEIKFMKKPKFMEKGNTDKLIINSTCDDIYFNEGKAALIIPNGKFRNKSDFKVTDTFLYSLAMVLNNLPKGNYKFEFYFNVNSVDNSPTLFRDIYTLGDENKLCLYRGDGRQGFKKFMQVDLVLNSEDILDNLSKIINKLGDMFSNVQDESNLKINYGEEVLVGISEIKEDSKEIKKDSEEIKKDSEEIKKDSEDMEWIKELSLVELIRCFIYNFIHIYYQKILYFITYFKILFYFILRYCFKILNHILLILWKCLLIITIYVLLILLAIEILIKYLKIIIEYFLLNVLIIVSIIVSVIKNVKFKLIFDICLLILTLYVLLIEKVIEILTLCVLLILLAIEILTKYLKIIIEYFLLIVLFIIYIIKNVTFKSIFDKIKEIKDWILWFWNEILIILLSFFVVLLGSFIYYVISKILSPFVCIKKWIKFLYTYRFFISAQATYRDEIFFRVLLRIILLSIVNIRKWNQNLYTYRYRLLITISWHKYHLLITISWLKYLFKFIFWLKYLFVIIYLSRIRIVWLIVWLIEKIKSWLKR